MSVIQIEQEMGLIFGNADIRSSFEQAWTSYVPALLHYGEKKAIKEIHSQLVDTGMLLLSTLSAHAASLRLQMMLHDKRSPYTCLWQL